MSLQRERKEQKVVELKEIFDSARIVVVTHYSGSTVADLTQLREHLAANNGKLQITKNRLALHAIEGTKADVLKPYFSGPTAIATSDDEGALTLLPKAIVDFGKTHENLKLVGGVMDGALLDQNEVKALAALPSKNDLRAKLIGLITQPASKIITILNQPGSKIVRVLSARVAGGDSN